MRILVLALLATGGAAGVFFWNRSAREGAPVECSSCCQLKDSGGLLTSLPAAMAEGEEQDASAAPAAASEEKKDEKKEDKAEGEAKEGDEKKDEPPVEIDPTLGIIAGKITLKGDPPKLDEKAVSVPENHNDHAFCSKHVKDERLILGEKGEIANVVVYVDDYKVRGAPRAKPRTTVIDNKGCLFHPHVVGTTVGSTLELKNSDGFIHNSRGLLSIGNINSAIPPAGTVKKKASKPGWGIMKCDFHSWMTAHVHVFDHEMFAVTDEDGNFKIYNVPPGKHTLKIWHEVLENGEEEVTVEAGKTIEVEPTLEAYKD